MSYRGLKGGYGWSGRVAPIFHVEPSEVSKEVGLACDGVIYERSWTIKRAFHFGCFCLFCLNLFVVPDDLNVNVGL